ncbi:MAG: hypothetical protein CFE32_20430, partial [Alphaproteobacteria bacterium PA3]
IHGLGLATKLLSLRPSPNGLVANLIGFNIGVEVGQFLALAIAIALLMRFRRGEDNRTAMLANTGLMAGGFVLAGYHLVEFVAGGTVT